MAAWESSRSHFLSAPPDAVFEVVSDLSLTAQWLQSFGGFLTRSTPVAEGQPVGFRPGGKLAARVHAKTAPDAVVSHLDTQERKVVVTQPQPGGRMELIFHVTPALDGAELVFTVRTFGRLGAIFGGQVGEKLLADFAVCAARLFRMLPETYPAKSPVKCVIAGGRGYLGRNLAADLICRGHDVFVLTRSEEEHFPAPQLMWDGRHRGTWTDVLLSQKKPVCVVNLAGDLSDVRPTETHLERMRDSRVNATEALSRAVAKLEQPIQTFVQASNAAIYGNGGEEHFTESSTLPMGSAALTQHAAVLVPWEDAASDVQARNFYILRNALVLGPDSPAVRRLQARAVTGFAGPLGDGEQWVSWIHLADWLKIVRTALGVTGNRLPSGVINATAPHPVRNKEFMALLRQRYAPQMLRSVSIPAPKAVVRLAAGLTGKDAQTTLTGRHVTSEVLAEAKFGFEYPNMEQAIVALDR